MMPPKRSQTDTVALIEPDHCEGLRHQAKRRRLSPQSAEKTIVEALLSLCNDKTRPTDPGKPLLHPTNFFSFPKTTPRGDDASVTVAASSASVVPADDSDRDAPAVSDDEDETPTSMTCINHCEKQQNKSYVLKIKCVLPAGRPLAAAPLFPSSLPDAKMK